MNTVLAWLRLVRVPNVPTAAADVLAGAAVVAGAERWRPLVGDDGLSLAAVVTASCLLYAAGMILNDVFDLEIDRTERPERPLPSGAVKTSTAAAAGAACLVGGVSLAAVAGLEAAAVAALLAAAILAYDIRLKRANVLSGVAMGTCRGLNVLLGMVAAASLLDAWPDPWLYGVAVANGVYVLGVTVFARGEADVSHRGRLATGAALVLAALIGHLGLCEVTGHADDVLPFALLAGLLAVRLLPALREPQPAFVQRAVGTMILCLIPLNAAVALAYAGWLPALAVLALLPLSLLAARWVYST